MATTRTAFEVRDVSHAEVERFADVGWVKLPGLVHSWSDM